LSYLRAVANCRRLIAIAVITSGTLVVPSLASASVKPSADTTTTTTTTPTTTTTDGGTGIDGGTTIAPPPTATAPVTLQLNSKGLVIIPANVPPVIDKILVAANKIAWDRYVYGGGHSGWGKQPGYDCSGSTSYVLHAAGLMDKVNKVRIDLPWDSSQFLRYGASGAGAGWLTVYTRPGHTFMKIANLYFDTGAQDPHTLPDGAPISGSKYRFGDRWATTEAHASGVAGFKVRHPQGW
jgi:hypothetical protein